MFLVPLRELDLFGVFVTPASVLFVLALVPSLAFRWVAARVDLNRYVWNRPLVEVSMFVLFYAVAVLTLRPG